MAIKSGEIKGKDSTMAWRLKKNGTLYIDGKGRMPDFSCGSNSDAPWLEDKEKITEVIFSDGITEIGVRSFLSCENLIKVSLPSSLSRIQSEAFFDCSKLREIVTGYEGASFKYIYDDDSDNNGKRWQHQDMIRFGIGSFYNVPWALERWGDCYVSGGILYCCLAESEKLSLPNGIKVIREFAFRKTRVLSLDLPDSLEKICEFAFSGSKIRSLVIPEKVKTIEDYAFADCMLDQIKFSRNMSCKLSKRTFSGSKFTFRCKKDRIPDFYEVSLKSDKKHYGDFKHLEVKEKKVKKNRKGEIVKRIYGMQHVNVGESIYRRIRRGSAILMIGSNGNHVSWVVSFAWSACRKCIVAYVHCPCMNENDEGNWNESVAFLGKENLMDVFLDEDPVNLMEKGTLRKTNEDENWKEEWFWNSSCAGFGGDLEQKLLHYWLDNHPDMIVDLYDIELCRKKMGGIGCL